MTSNDLKLGKKKYSFIGKAVDRRVKNSTTQPAILDLKNQFASLYLT